jgi:hypothetical protein
MEELNAKLEELLAEYDYYVQEGIIIGESEKDRAFKLIKMLQQSIKDLDTKESFEKSVKETSKNY